MATAVRIARGVIGRSAPVGRCRASGDARARPRPTAALLSRAAAAAAARSSRELELKARCRIEPATTRAVRPSTQALRGRRSRIANRRSSSIATSTSTPTSSGSESSFAISGAERSSAVSTMRGDPARNTISGSVPASSSTESAGAAASSRPRERSDGASDTRGNRSAKPGAQRNVEPSIASGAPLDTRTRGRAGLPDVAPPHSTTSRASESPEARNAGCARIARSTAAGQPGSTTVATRASEDVSTATVSSSASASPGDRRASTLRTGARASNGIVVVAPGSIETSRAPSTPASVVTTTRRDSARSPALVICTWIASAVASPGCGRALNRAMPTLRESSATCSTRVTGAAASQALTLASAPSVSNQCDLDRSTCAGSGSRGSRLPACEVIVPRSGGPRPVPARMGLLSTLVSTSRTPAARRAVAARSSPRSSRVRPD